MKIAILHQTVTNHDAIGNDIEAMYHIMNDIGTCYVYAEHRFNTSVSYMEKKDLMELVQEENNLVIYHHSVFWQEGEQILDQCKCKVIIRYHNITPPEFFEPYNAHHTSQCSQGREQTKRMEQKFENAFWLLDSQYNGEDVPSIPEARRYICAPFHKIESWSTATPDEEILSRLLYSQDCNLLFVSRVAPNKGHMFLLEVLARYRASFGDDIKLHIIGKFDEGLRDYNEKIKEYISRYGLEPCLNFVGEVTDSILVSYYLGCDFFVCASDHEGFGVPLIESQYFKLPVIAKDTSAVSETLGQKQIILEDSPKEFAAAIAVLRNNRAYYHYLQQEGRKNYDARFTNAILKDALTTALGKFGVL